MDNITMTGKGLMVRVVAADGRVDNVRLAKGLVYTATHPQWHKKGLQDPTRCMTAVEAARFVDIDSEFDPELQQLAVLSFVPGTNGKKYTIRLIPYGVVQRKPETDEDGNPVGDPIVFGEPVKTGIQGFAQWAEFNQGGPFKKSPSYEVISLHDMARIMQEEVKDTDGNDIIIESVGVLGKNGEDGFFFSTELPEWDAAIAERLGTRVKEFFHLTGMYNGLLAAYNSGVVALCQNTLLRGQAEASMIRKMDHLFGAEDRLREGIRTVYGSAMQQRGYSMAIAVAMADKMVNEDDVRWIAEEVFKLPNEPDQDFIGKTTMAQRFEAFKKAEAKALAQREAAVEFFKNPEWHTMVGVTPQTAGSAWAAWQGFTFMATHAPMNPDRSFQSTFISGGENNRMIVNSYKKIMELVKA